MDRALPSVPKRARHQEQLDEMHDALYQLGDTARVPHRGFGADLLPDHVAPKEKPEHKAAKAHIGRLYKAFKAARKGTKEK